MRLRILIAVAATFVLAGCSDTSTTAPQQMRPAPRLSDELTCRSGYYIATREDGTQYCEVEEGANFAP